jgi:hypothetical protein
MSTVNETNEKVKDRNHNASLFLYDRGITAIHAYKKANKKRVFSSSPDRFIQIPSPKAMAPLYTTEPDQTRTKDV